VPFAPLLPFMPAMIAALKVKGKPAGGDIKHVANNFFKYVIKGSNFEPEELYGINEIDTESDTFDPVTITAIVTAVINYIKAAKKKKAQDRTAEENAAVHAADKAAEEAVKAGMKGTDAGKASVKSFFEDNKIVLIIAAVVLAFVIFKK